eukprot:1195600-Prorocentrum_minimum.AAC.5
MQIHRRVHNQVRLKPGVGSADQVRLSLVLHLLTRCDLAWCYIKNASRCSVARELSQLYADDNDMAYYSYATCGENSPFTSGDVGSLRGKTTLRVPLEAAPPVVGSKAAIKGTG